MGKNKKIQDYDWFYSFLRYYVDALLKLSYRRIKYVGRERVPGDGAVIYAPNHTGTLMDALVILAMDKKPKVFVARADIFKNPTLAKIFRFLKIMPIMRMRDGFDEVKKNNRTIEQATDVLRDKVPFCIFPEGTHQTKYSLQSISKGIFRIALQAKELMPETPLYIVPVGIRYGSFWRFRASARIQVGEPMNVGEIMEQNADKTPQELMNVMRVRLDALMKDTLYYIPNDENYNASYEICGAVANAQACGHKGLDKSFFANKATMKKLGEIKENNPELAAKLFALGNEAAKMRKERGISMNSVAAKRPLIKRLPQLLLTLLFLPYVVLSAVCVSPMLLICNVVFKKFKDQAFRNSVRFMMNLVLWPLLMIIYSVIAYVCMPWFEALPLTLALLFAPYVVHDVYRTLRLAVSDIRLLLCRPLRKIYADIRNLMFK